MMERQIFINEVKATFNLREPKANKPTNIYLVCRVQGKQVKLSTGVKVYPEHWSKDKQEAYISFRLSELDNRNNEIANNKINELKAYFSSYKKYLCDNPDKLDSCLEILKDHIYKDNTSRRMTKTQNISATTRMQRIIAERTDIGDSSKTEQARVIKKFALFLKENKISDSWDHMNCDTLNKFQNYLISDNKSPNTIRNYFAHIQTLLKLANKRTDIPFKWSDNNIDSFEVIKNKANKTKRNEKKVALTIEQVKDIYNYTPKGRNATRETEIKDMFVLQCLVGQRISDMPKFLNGEYELDTKNNTISIIQQKTGELAIIPLFNEAKEILAKYKEGLKYPEILERKGSPTYNRAIKAICKDVGLNEEIEYQEQKGTKVETFKVPLYELIHSHTARHTFITIMCRMDIPKEDIIIATGHNDTTMIDEVYEHLNDKDKSNKIKKAISNKIGDSFFNAKEQKTEEPFKKEKVNTKYKKTIEDYYNLFKNIDVFTYFFELHPDTNEILWNDIIYTIDDIKLFFSTEAGYNCANNFYERILEYINTNAGDEKLVYNILKRQKEIFGFQ
ncbi:tyrosine-type recombinase/integrase [Parabacteroides goldsteinii]|uniref:tyrosine-type recombinase/integrase n=2 Tax=Parabacteroides goldsteinii TaxID=328812 RepID=UPI003AB8C0D9